MRRRILSRSQQARRDRRRPLCSLHACREKEKFSYVAVAQIFFIYDELETRKNDSELPQRNFLSTVCSHCLIAKKNRSGFFSFFAKAMQFAAMLPAQKREEALMCNACVLLFPPLLVRRLLR